MGGTGIGNDVGLWLTGETFERPDELVYADKRPINLLKASNRPDLLLEVWIEGFPF